MSSTNERIANLVFDTLVRSRDTVGDAARRAISVLSEAVGPVDSLAEGVDKGREVLLNVARELVADGESSLDFDVDDEVASSPQVPVSAGAKERFKKLLKSDTPDDESVRRDRFDRTAQQLNVDEARILEWLNRSGRVAAIELRGSPVTGLRARRFAGVLSRAAVQAGCVQTAWSSHYLDCLLQLGLVELAPADKDLKSDYEYLRAGKEFNLIAERFEQDFDLKLKPAELTLQLSAFGMEFCQHCLRDGDGRKSS